MRKLAFIAMFGLALAACGAQARESTPVRIELHPIVQAAAGDVTLGDVAGMTTASLPLLKSLVALPLGPAPRAGESVRLQRAEIARWIQVRTGLDASQLEWTGPSSVDVQRASSQVSGERIALAAQESLRDWLAARGGRADISVTSAPRDVTVPPGQLTVKPRPIADGQPLARRTSVWVDLWVDGRFVRTVAVGFDVAGYVPAAVGAGAEPPSGAPLKAAAAATAAIDPRPAVARGDWVALRVRSGAMEFESRAEVLQEGRVGQRVRVKPRGATDVLDARVTAPGQVEISQ